MSLDSYDKKNIKISGSLPGSRNVTSVGNSGVRQMSGLMVEAKRKTVNTSGDHRSESVSQAYSGSIKSSGANGRMTLSIQAERKIKSESLEYLMRKTGKFEFFWYPTFFVLGVLCLILIPLFTEMTFASYVLLLTSVLNLWLCMTANNLVARGVRLGLLLSALNMLIYVGISVYQKVWGEVLINVLMYIPLEILGFFNWGKESEGKIDAVYKMNGVTLLKYIALFLGLTAGVWAGLEYGLSQEFAIFNAVSIAGCIVGDFARNKRYFEVWYFFMICNIAGIILWALQIFASGDQITFAIMPTMISFLATLSNNFNGIYIWSVLYKNKHKNGGVFLAKRQVDIRKIVALKRTYRRMKCKEL